MSATLYRQTNVGQALVDALDQMVEEGKIPGPLAHKVVEQFDASVLEMLDSKVSARGNLRGKLEVYRYCDNVWTFILSGARLRVTPQGSRRDETEMDIDTLKMVLVDENVVHRQREEGGQ